MYCIRAGGSFFHDINADCGWCCETCNLDMHRCGGCGDSIPHVSQGCDECMAAHWETIEYYKMRQ